MDLYAKTEKKMEEMQLTSALTWIEVQFMKKAVDEVFRCRMTLKWTYAMAYYLQKGNEKEIFEDNQRFGTPFGNERAGTDENSRDLEKAVEDLSGLLEQPIDTETIGALRQKVTDKAVSASPTVFAANRSLAKRRLGDFSGLRAEEERDSARGFR